MSSQLYLLGTGIRGCLQLTVEVQQALSVCRRAFVLHADTQVLKELETYCPEVIDLEEMYTGQEIRREAYHAIAARVVDSAAEDGPVAFVVHGHPLFLVSASEYTLELAKSKGLRATALPGVSSFDTLLCDLGLDLGYGVQMYDTTSLLNNGWVPDPKVPLLLFQLATTQEDRVVRDDRDGEVLRPVVDLLKSLYGDDHVVTLVQSAAAVLDTPRIEEYRLADLATSAVDLTSRPTVYVPPVPAA